MNRWIRTMALVAVVVLVVPVAGAQPAAPGTPPATGAPASTEFGIRAPAPPAGPPALRLEPTRPAEERGAREQDFFPGYLVRSRHEPAFVEPFVGFVPTSKDTRARVGVSGWTAPALPHDMREESGGVAFGLTFEWSFPAPPPPPRAPEPEQAGQR